MLPREELRRLARARLRDARALFDAKRYDAAAYIAGYAVEAALKARICRTLHWEEFPVTRGEFQAYQSFRTHDLNVLLKLSGADPRVREKCLGAWSDVIRWNPEMRYVQIGSVKKETVASMIQAVAILLRSI